MTIPAATYRLQLRRELSLDAVRGLVPTLARLGISDLYLSPLSTARPGSPHGYDIVDHRRLNPELGDEGALEGLLDAARAAGLGVIVDVVPNHMCIAGDMNQLWMDVLEDGRESPNAAYFDIDWDPPKPELVAKVLLPFLGEQYGRVLEEGLAVTFVGGRFFATWDGGRLPLRPQSWPRLLEPALQELRERAASPEDAAVIELESILRALSQTLPALRANGNGGAAGGAAGGAGAAAPGGVSDAPTEHRHEKEAIVRRLAALAESSAPARDAIARAVTRVNGTRGQPATFDELERVMNDQCYRLANWRVAAHEVNYRRFFDINELAAVRVEDPRVFDDVHALVFGLARHPAFTGVRVDHLDGLYDPERYLVDLGRGLGGAASTAGSASASDGDRGDGATSRPFIIVEKILGPGETLPAGWLCDGTTGYDMIRILADLFVRPEGATRLRAVAAPFGALSSSFDEVAYQSKRLVLQTTLAAELTMLARRLDRVSEQHRYTRDFTLNHLQEVLGEILACFPVYRTYIRRDDAHVAGRDADAITRAVSAARRRNPLLNASLFDFVESVLLRRDPPELPEPAIAERRTFVARFQQLTGPVFAKGVEDTAFYRYLPLVALNEVGGDPTRMGAAAIDDVHAALGARRAARPHTLSATATHDTKRGEDTRARLYVLSEVADDWASATAAWSMLNAPYKSDVDGAAAPDGAEEYLLYQTLVGAWPTGGWSSEPDFPARVCAYMTKARHEAKTHTSWINPDPAYDRAAEQFVRAALDRRESAKFLDGVEAFVATIRRPGLWNALSQVVTKIAAPGVPDFFQGTELWDFSLVDPDNRRLVDFERRRAWLDELYADFEARQTAAIDAWFDAPEDGRIKLWITAAGLRLRRARRDLFTHGTYQALEVGGARAGHGFAFARALDGATAIAVVGRFFATLGADRPTGRAWGDTFLRLPPALENQRFRDALTGRAWSARQGRLPLGDVFTHLPVALLEAAP